MAISRTLVKLVTRNLQAHQRGAMAHKGVIAWRKADASYPLQAVPAQQDIEAKLYGSDGRSDDQV